MPPSISSAWCRRDIISIRDLTREDIETILVEARQIRPAPQLLQGRVMASLFFEPSTRTQLSFATAMQRLGGQVIGFSGVESSSLVKGESLQDTAKVVERYADIMIVRHPLEGSVRLVADTVSIPVINAGDGANQHPTQTLTDLFTMQKFHGRLDELKIGMVGDLKYGRTVHSLVLGLTRFRKIDLRLISPDNLRMPAPILKELHGIVPYVETDELDLRDLDVVYVTRIQKERFPDIEEYEKVKGTYVIDLKMCEMLKREAILLHPLPRVGEIAVTVDRLPQAKYFEQSENGVPVRMALLKLLLGG